MILLRKIIGEWQEGSADNLLNIEKNNHFKQWRFKNEQFIYEII